jgi:hypothetical protein
MLVSTATRGPTQRVPSRSERDQIPSEKQTFLRIYAQSPSARMAKRVLTPAGSRPTMALTPDIYAKHARIVHALPEEPPRARGTGDLGLAKAAAPVLFVGLWTITGPVWAVF